jgi:hypothetical protein
VKGREGRGAARLAFFATRASVFLLNPYALPF